VGLILDLAVVALAAVVIGSLALLAWTLAVSAVRASHRERQRIVDLRRSVADAEARLATASARASDSMAGLVDRTSRGTGAGTTHRHDQPGDDPDE
jgi:hypothetical protein